MSWRSFAEGYEVEQLEARFRRKQKSDVCGLVVESAKNRSKFDAGGGWSGNSTLAIAHSGTSVTPLGSHATSALIVARTGSGRGLAFTRLRVFRNSRAPDLRRPNGFLETRIKFGSSTSYGVTRALFEVADHSRQPPAEKRSTRECSVSSSGA